jgi:DNA-binding LytR/AlgR family response regulator
MNKIKTLLIDDEFLALNLLEEFIKKCPQLEVVGKVKSAIAAASFLNEHEVDLMFLDIQMPHLSGNQFLKSLQNPPVTIFTTAYTDYAVEAFSLNAVDYLLKPFSFERFFQAVQKAEKEINSRNKNTKNGQADFITIKSDGVLHKINLKDIVLIEGSKEYLKIICINKKYVILDSMKNMEELLSDEHFIRIHKSYIVAKNRITSLEGFFVYLGKLKLPISRTKKKEIQDTIFK